MRVMAKSKSVKRKSNTLKNAKKIAVKNLVYDELTLSEIAFQLGYSNVAYLSNQFKKITGLTPTYFKAIKDNKRQSIEKV